MKRDLKITVLMGGPSREREVSLSTGMAVLDALVERGFDATGYVVEDARIDGVTPDDADVVFIALHGTFGEDGGVQEILDSRGVPYTGSGAAASRLAMNKVESKRIFIENNVPTAPFIALEEGSADEPAVEKYLGFPCVVKPAREGSSFGVSVVRRSEDLGRALEAAFGCDGLLLAEKYISGRELTCGVLGGEALPLVELLPAREFYDYTAKYSPGGGTRYSLDVDLAQGLYDEIQKYSVRACDALGVRGAARVDLMLSEKNEPFMLEVNTIPGMTVRSLLPMAAKAHGIDFGGLCERIVELALQESDRR